MSEPQLMVDRLLRAINDHDLDALAACFAKDYENETPLHPAAASAAAGACGATEQIFAFVPDLRAEVTRSAVDGEVVWTEWEMKGTRRDRSTHCMRGVVIFRRGRRRRAVGAFLSGARRAQRRHGRRGRARAGRALMIAIAGGTGRLGSLLTRRLADRGLDVRVITRDPARAGHLRGLPIEIVTADVRDRARIRAALEGATAVISAVHGFAGPGRVSPGSVDRDGNANLIDAAAELGVDVILISVVGAAGDHPMELFRAKHVAEQHLIASNTRWTIVRATAFLELWDEIMTKPIVFGRGENPINFVSVNDVAAVVEGAVLDAALRGEIIDWWTAEPHLQSTRRTAAPSPAAHRERCATSRGRPSGSPRRSAARRARRSRWTRST